MKKKCDIQHLNEEGTIAGPSFHKLFYFSSNRETLFFFLSLSDVFLFIFLFIQIILEAAYEPNGHQHMNRCFL